MMATLHRAIAHLILVSTALTPALAAGAESWTPIGPAGATVMSIEYDPFTARRILAGTYFGGLYESNDDGATWKHVETAFGTFSVFAVAFDPSRRGVVYVGSLLGGVFKSEDGGVTWAARNKGLPDLVVQAVAIDPANPGTLLAVTGNKLLRSSDGAENWSLVPLAQEAGVPSCLLWDYRSPGSVYLGT